MSYKIEYSPQYNNKFPIKNLRSGRKKFTRFMIVLFIIGCLCVPKIRSTLVKILVPGDDEVTKASFQIMMEQLKEGQPMLEAVSTFCEEIINDEA